MKDVKIHNIKLKKVKVEVEETSGCKFFGNSVNL